MVTRSVAYQHDPSTWFLVSHIPFPRALQHGFPWHLKGFPVVSSRIPRRRTSWLHGGVSSCSPFGVSSIMFMALPKLQPVVPRFDPLDPNMFSGVYQVLFPSWYHQRCSLWPIRRPYNVVPRALKRGSLWNNIVIVDHRLTNVLPQWPHQNYYQRGSQFFHNLIM